MKFKSTKYTIDWDRFITMLREAVHSRDQSDDNYVEPSDWQARLMSKIKLSPAAPVVVVVEELFATAFALKLSAFSAACACCLMIALSVNPSSTVSSSASNSDQVLGAVPKFSAVQILWGE